MWAFIAILILRRISEREDFIDFSLSLSLSLTSLSLFHIIFFSRRLQRQKVIPIVLAWLIWGLNIKKGDADDDIKTYP